MIRGGVWNDAAACCRASGRHAFDPTYRHYSIGFRVALSMDAVRQAIKAEANSAGGVRTGRDSAK